MVASSRLGVLSSDSFAPGVDQVDPGAKEVVYVPWCSGEYGSGGLCPSGLGGRSLTRKTNTRIGTKNGAGPIAVQD